MLHSCGIGAPALGVLLDDPYGPLTTDKQRLPFVDLPSTPRYVEQLSALIMSRTNFTASATTSTLFF